MEESKVLNLINLLHNDVWLPVTDIARIAKYSTKTIYLILDSQQCNRLQEYKIFPRILKRWDNVNAELISIASKK
jgi:hypothetical protein